METVLVEGCVDTDWIYSYTGELHLLGSCYLICQVLSAEKHIFGDWGIFGD